jgi:hypothetical protein
MEPRQKALNNKGGRVSESDLPSTLKSIGRKMGTRPANTHDRKKDRYLSEDSMVGKRQTGKPYYPSN